MSDLRSRLIRLAATNKSLRPGLLKILEPGKLRPRKGNTVVIQQAPIVIQNGGPGEQVVSPGGMISSPFAQPATPPPPPAVPAPAPTALLGKEPEISSLFVPERTERGFNSDLLPALKKLVAQGMGKEEAARTLLSMVRAAFVKKDMLYNILIQYQSSYENDKSFLEGLERLIESWVTSHTGV